MEHEQTIPEQRKQEENAPEPGTPDAAADAAPDAAQPGPRRRGGGRTVLLIAGAAVLGVLAGTITGYAIQYDREPTPLAPLAQAHLVAPKALAPDEATTNKTINANRWHKTDDDLAKLLIEAPGGAKKEGSGYITPDFLALDFEHPDRAVRNFAATGLRRAASANWSQDDRIFVEVTLLQFNNRSGAEDYQSDQSRYMPEKKYAGNDGVAIDGLPSSLGHVWVYSEADEKPGYLPLRSAHAIARRGDLVLEIHYVNNQGKIAEGDVMELAKRQLERL
ncbi:hypothetical protein [Streptomyces sp. NBC_00503]|uniref:hypothetical protein n=1 Tax=Streptomyces sp. NBC_00503 TaxID=2903659 RepID=UPI002E80A30A|nr:hypothetical protein [Streptomyces sp. NBC_00503]WUD82148.1 hypothetical protein OG490_17250 [Streptomyces sp. NBC_00503]